ncbi:MAG TPA: glycosyltransferase [Chthoniobacteraceae bacterium]|nr:glycosyltransferase [Chthoniobacteraceae bacterium]
MDFTADPAFFWRDSGLLCRTLQTMGHESQVVLLGSPRRDDPPDVVRATAEELSSEAWWRSKTLDGVIMVAWARHRDTPMVRAIAASGTPLVIHLDGSGISYPLFEVISTFKMFWCAGRGTGKGWMYRSFKFLKAASITAVKHLLRHSYHCYWHLRYATVATLQTPESLLQRQRTCTLLGGRNHKVNLRLVGYPISTDCRWDATPKEKRIIAIGRWSDLWQKRTHVLMAVSERIASLHPDLHIDIFGEKTDALAQWHARLNPDLQQRIHVHGIQPGAITTRAMQKAQVSFFPSSFEGGPQALFECLACGATTVGLDTPYLPGTRWAATSHHGDLVLQDTDEAYVNALDRALKKWERGDYSPQEISDYWIPYTHAQAILTSMMEAATKALPPGKHVKRPT